MAISPVGPSALPSLPTLPVTSSPETQATSPTGSSFGDLITNALDNVQAAQANADSLASAAATGNLTNVHDYLIATTQATLDTQLTVAVRNKALEAFQSIMSMPV